jgi:hypothetical protein
MNYIQRNYKIRKLTNNYGLQRRHIKALGVNMDAELRYRNILRGLAAEL